MTISKQFLTIKFLILKTKKKNNKNKKSKKRDDGTLLFEMVISDTKPIIYSRDLIYLVNVLQKFCLERRYLGDTYGRIVHNIVVTKGPVVS